jgi:hypothetical protein
MVLIKIIEAGLFPRGLIFRKACDQIETITFQKSHRTSKEKSATKATRLHFQDYASSYHEKT